MVIEALELRLVPLPGVGLINSPIVLLLLLGVALCFVGLIASRQAGGRIWIEFERRQLQISGAPRKRNDPLFEREFEHCMTLVRASIEST